jgi:nucleoside-specific outer membrane channel protein Tsx
MKNVLFAATTLIALAATSTAGLAQLQERPQIPREWYSEVVLWNYGDLRPERQAEGCLRWGTHTRTWYDICRFARRPAVSVRY